MVISHLSCIEHIFPQCSVVFMSPFPAQREKFDRMDIKFCHLSYIKTSSPLYSITYSPPPAQRLGLHAEGQMSLSGEELDKMDLGHLSRIINKVDVFYRVTPRNKVKIVKVRADIVLKCWIFFVEKKSYLVKEVIMPFIFIQYIEYTCVNWWQIIMIFCLSTFCLIQASASAWI